LIEINAAGGAHRPWYDRQRPRLSPTELESRVAAQDHLRHVFSPAHLTKLLTRSQSIFLRRPQSQILRSDQPCRLAMSRARGSGSECRTMPRLRKQGHRWKGAANYWNTRI